MNENFLDRVIRFAAAGGNRLPAPLQTPGDVSRRQNPLRRDERSVSGASQSADGGKLFAEFQILAVGDIVANRNAKCPNRKNL
jgi:hypothetical protein